MEKTPPKGATARDSIVPAEQDGSPTTLQERKKQLLREWQGNTKAASLSHRFESRRLGRLSVILGVWIIALSMVSVVLSAVTAGHSPVGVIGAAVGAVAAILATIQTFVRFDSRSAASHVAASEYGALLRRIGVLLAEDDPSDVEIALVRKDLDNAADKTPVISEKAVKEGRKAAGLE